MAAWYIHMIFPSKGKGSEKKPGTSLVFCQTPLTEKIFSKIEVWLFTTLRSPPVSTSKKTHEGGLGGGFGGGLGGHMKVDLGVRGRGRGPGGRTSSHSIREIFL